MTRITRAWGALAPEQRIASVAALALLVTMFLPWYDLQSLNRKTGVINSHAISAFGDVSFVEAAVFLVAAGVIALMLGRAERRDFHMPGSDGAVVMVAGAWATLLIFYRVFSRPAGHGYPVGIEWGFFLAFVAAGVLGYAGWRMRATNVPEAPLMRRRGRPGPSERPSARDDVDVVEPSPRRAERAAPVAARPSQPSPHDDPAIEPTIHPSEDITSVVEQGAQTSQRTTPSPPSTQSGPPSAPPAASPRAPGSKDSRAPKRPRFPPPPSDQLSFDDSPSEPDEH